MISSVREIREITDERALLELEAQFDTDLHKNLTPLIKLLDQNVLSQDTTSVLKHMAEVECWRGRLVRLLSLAAAFVEHSKGEAFLKPKEKGVTDTDREAHRKHMSAGFIAQSTLLEGLIECVDSRVNLAKKITGIEFTGAKYGSQGVAA